MANWADGLDPRFRPWAEAIFQAIHGLDASARVTSAFRSRAEQERLYRRFLAGLNKYPVAPPGRSHHEYGRAIDVAARPEVLRGVGAEWKKLGGIWSPTDEIHFAA